jgi:hypothetical protein
MMNPATSPDQILPRACLILQVAADFAQTLETVDRVFLEAAED